MEYIKNFIEEGIAMEDLFELRVMYLRYIISEGIVKSVKSGEFIGYYNKRIGEIKKNNSRYRRHN
ncbi:hypothetical protein BEH94_01635 [Candidatus Altiarchaeales archaeon WOR_SM1_SCG]|nr:hypothetical protein BEH94_01635 [Candidatus Altiarchaeales archaeon WOR_SM1_SCG]